MKFFSIKHVKSTKNALADQNSYRRQEAGFLCQWVIRLFGLLQGNSYESVTAECYYARRFIHSNWVLKEGFKGNIYWWMIHQREKIFFEPKNDDCGLEVSNIAIIFQCLYGKIFREWVSVRILWCYKSHVPQLSKKMMGASC